MGIPETVSAVRLRRLRSGGAVSILVAMASIWRGSLSFGLVNVQVKVHPATQDNAVSFHQVHAADGGRVRYRRVCDVCAETVEYRDLAKAFESSSGQSVIVTEDDLASLPAGRTREIDVVEFVPSSEVDPILFDRSYYLEPEQLSIRPYVLLRQALERTERTAIAHVALRNRTRLAALRVYQDVIMLQTMLWRDEVRAADFAVLRDIDIEPREQELKMAASLIETLEGDFEPEKYTDRYRVDLLSLIDRKLTDQEDVITPSEQDQDGSEPTNVVDLMSALQASIDQNNASRTGSDDG